MELKSDTNRNSHNDSIITQFTKQAVPFAQMSQHSNHYGLNLMFKLSEPGKDDTVLDVACGPGIVACEYAKLVNQVTGIDLTPAMIEQARFHQKEKRLNNIDWRVGDVSNLPFDDESFSIVITRSSFHHIIDPKRVLEEMKRVCKTGGKILVVDVTPDHDKKDAYNHVEKLRDTSYTEALILEELKEMMKNVGAVNIRTEHQDLEMNLETILQSSFPKPGDRDKIIQLFEQDLTDENLGMKSHLVNGLIHFYFPISMIIGFKGK